MINPITHILNKDCIIFNKIKFVKIKNALCDKDKAPSEAVYANRLTFALQLPCLWHPPPLEEPENRIRGWYPTGQDTHDSSQLQWSGMGKVES